LDPSEQKEKSVHHHHHLVLICVAGLPACLPASAFFFTTSGLLRVFVSVLNIFYS
jgi:hypothetical protein